MNRENMKRKDTPFKIIFIILLVAFCLILLQSKFNIFYNDVDNNSENKLESASFISEIYKENATLNFAVEANFTLEFYKQNIENDLYTKVDSIILNGNIGNDTNIIAAQYENKYLHFNLVDIENTTILHDGSAIAKIIYDRELYSLDINLTVGGGVVTNGNYTTGGIYKYGKEIEVAVLVHEGYKIEKWQKNGAAVLNNNSSLFVNTKLETFILDGNTIIEVFFIPKINEIVFDINNSFTAVASGSMESIFSASNSTIIIPKNNYVLIGYKFLGWSTTRNGYPTYKEGDNFVVGTNSIIGLFAIWQEKANVDIDITDLEDKSYTYNGLSQTITGNIFTNNTDYNNEINISNNIFKDVPSEGYLEILIKSLESDNFKYAEVSLQIPIYKKIAEIEFIIPSILIEGNYSNVNAIVLNAIGDDNVNCILENNINKDAGNYTAKIIALDNSNYQLADSGLTCDYSISYKNIKDKDSLCIIESDNGIPYSTILNITLITSEKKFFAGDRNKVLIKTYHLNAIQNKNNISLNGDYKIAIQFNFELPIDVNFYVYVMENNKYIIKDVFVENGFIIFNASNVEKIYIARDILKEESKETLWVVLASCAFTVILLQILILVIQKKKEKEGKGKTFKFYSLAILPILLNVNVELTAIIIFVIECGIILLLLGFIALNIYESKKAVKVDKARKLEEAKLMQKEKKNKKKNINIK